MSRLRATATLEESEVVLCFPRRAVAGWGFRWPCASVKRPTLSGQRLPPTRPTRRLAAALEAAKVSPLAPPQPLEGHMRRSVSILGAVCLLLLVTVAPAAAAQ